MATQHVIRVVTLTLCLAGPFAVLAEVERIRVGVYHNPPKVVVTESGQPTGFWPALTRAIAAHEGWKIEWVQGTWDESLDRLRDNRIDVLLDTAVTEARRQRFAFGNETVVVSWSRVYAAPGASIETLPDLRGKRIGVLAQSVNLDGPEGVQALLDQFGVAAELITMPDYSAIFSALQTGSLDAGVANRDFGNHIESRSDVVRTPILFQPADLRYAFTKAAPLTPELSRRFDARVAMYKQDPDSVYYALQDQWLGLQTGDADRALPVWLQWSIAALLGITAVLAGGVALVESRVRTRTRRLREQQAELKRQEQMLAESQRIAHVGSWQLDLPTNKLKWSDETFRIAGLSPQSITPTVEAFFAHVHPDDLPALHRARTPALQGADTHDVSFRIIRPDGEVRRVHERAEVEFDAAGNIVCLRGTIQDVTEQEHLEERMLHFHQLVEGSEDLCGICDADYRYLWVNKTYGERYGCVRAEIEGCYLWEILGEEYFQNTVKPRLDRCLAGEIQRFETQREFAGLGPRQLLTRYYPIETSQGHVSYVGAVITDITELKQAETTVEEQARLVDIAGRVARLGGWSVALPEANITWSNVLSEIHGLPIDDTPGLDEAIGFYAIEHQERIRTLYLACVEHGTPFDEELQITNAQGAPVWVRVVGEPVRDDNGNIIRVQGALQDVSARKKSEQQTERLAHSLRTTLESITDAFFTLNRNWRFGYVNAAAEQLLERRREELIGRDVWEAFPEAVGTPIEREYRRAISDGVTVALDEYYPPLGKWFDIRAYPSEDGLAVYFLDVTERHAMIERLRAQEETLRRSRDHLAGLLDSRRVLINSLPAHIALLDRDGTILDVNDQWRHFGMENAYAAADFGVGTNYLRVCDQASGGDAAEVATGLRQVLAGEREVFSLEYPCHSPEQLRWFRVMINRLLTGDHHSEHHGVVVMHVDITERKLAEQELNRLAFQDPLTGLPSRNGFARSLSERIESSGWKPAAIVVVLDIMGLRDINDAHGYDTGDRLLIKLSERLREQAGRHGLAARTGGDEFVLFLPPEPHRAPEKSLATLSAALSEPYDLEGVEIEIATRIGYTHMADKPRPVENLLREAELALFQNREDLGQSWVAYTSELDHAARQRIELTHELRKALEEIQFEMYFQPKVDLTNGRIISCEALLRWNHPKHGLQSPGLFIPIAEKSQLIGPIGDWILRDTCRQLRAWQDAGLRVVPVAINVSLVQFMSGDFPQTVRSALSAFALSPDNLSFEITESVFERESESLRMQLQNLHEFGVRLSLDDFGTGYSSLRYLQKYPFDEIKIDQSFVRYILDDPNSREIVGTVLGLARAFEAEVVAEGIESIEVRDALLELGCRMGQGYYYSYPLKAEDFCRLLENQTHLPLAHADV